MKSQLSVVESARAYFGSLLWPIFVAVLLCAPARLAPALGADQTTDQSADSFADPFADSFVAAPVPPAGSVYRNYNTNDRSFVNRFLKPGQYMHESEIKPGMEGYGLSVFKGSKVERFDIKVIGVMRQSLNGRDAILVRMSGRALERNNVVRGMSGSPVYIDDKLIGAISYGFDFSKDPIAGVTPIVDMLDALAKPSDAPKGRVTGKISGPIDLRGRMVIGDSPGRSLSNLQRSMLSSGSPEMVPLMTPVSLSGFSPRAQQYLKDRLGRFGLRVSQGTSGGLNEELIKLDPRAADNLVPGSAVSVLLSTGDFTSAATGTVTALFGKRLLAFGHPFLGSGSLDVPMGSAYVHDILPSLSVSFKLSSPMKVLGSIYADRPWSVGGELGRSSRMIPLSIRIVDEERHLEKSFKSQVLDHQDFTPDMLAGTVISALDASFQSAAPYVIKLDSSIKVRDGPTIKRQDQFASGETATGAGSILSLMPFFSDPVAGYVRSTASRVYGNKFRRASLESVDLDIRLKPGRNVTEIERVVVDRPVVKPGEKVVLSCLLDPFDGEKYVRRVELEIPRNAPDGDLVIGVTGGSKLGELRKRMNLLDPPSENLEQHLKKVEDRPRADELIAVLALPDQAVHIGGRAIQNPPAHWSRLLFSNRFTRGPALVDGEERVVLPLDTHLNGSHIVAVTVKRPVEYMKKSAWLPLDSQGSDKASSGIYITRQAQKVLEASSKSSLPVKISGAPVSTSGPPATTGGTAGKPSASSDVWATGAEGVHTRSVRMWNQSAESDFAGGSRESVTIDSWGRIFPGFELSSRTDLLPDLRAWSCAFASGNLYVGTADRVMRWSGTGTPKLQAKLDSAMVPCMTADSAGNVYAAAVPSGKVFQVAPGFLREVFKPRESVISALCTDGSGNILVGTAGTGRLYKVSPTGGLISTFDTGQAHVTSLWYCRRENKVYIGTGESGSVFSLDASGKLSCEYQTDAHIVTGAVRDKQGNLYVVTAGDGELIRIKRTGHVDKLATSEAFFTLYYDDMSDSVFAGDAEGDITQIQIEPMNGRAFFVPVKRTEQEAVTALTGNGKGGLFAVTSNMPGLLSIKFRPDNSASFVSPVKDAGRRSQWSRLRLFGAFNESESKVESLLDVESRSGDSSKPDATWSDFVPAGRGADGFEIKSPPARFFQYRLSWTPGRFSDDERTVFPAGRGNVVGRVIVTYQPTNLPPGLSHLSLNAGDYLSDKVEVKLTASDADGDDVLVRVDLSSDNGKTWQLLADDVRPEGGDKKDSKDKESKDKESKDKERKEQDQKKDKDAKGKKGDKPVDAGGSERKDTKEAEPSEDPEKADEKGSDSSGGDSESGDDGSDSDSGQSGSDSGPEAGDSSEPDSSDSEPVPDTSEPESGRAEPESLKVRGKGIRGWHWTSWKRMDESKDAGSGKKGDGDAKGGGSGKKEPSDKAGAKSGKPGLKPKASPKKFTATKKPSWQVASGKSSKPAKSSDKLTWQWDTRKVKDGAYLLRFTVDDGPSNGGVGARSKVYRFVTVDNTKPKIESLDASWSGRDLSSIGLVAEDATSPVTNATVRFDDGEPWALAVSDGMADSRRVAFIARKIKANKKSKEVIVEVTDMAGNKATETIKLNTKLK